MHLGSSGIVICIETYTLIVTEEIKKYAIRHHQRLHNHENQKMKQMLNVDGNVCRLKRRKTYKLFV